MIAALCNQNIIAPFTVEGACNRTVFETRLETFLVPVLTTGQVVVMDNATFHKGGRIEELIQNAGCKVLYLPPYSPDLNKIEKCWSWITSRIRKHLDQARLPKRCDRECIALCVLTALAVAISQSLTTAIRLLVNRGINKLYIFLCLVGLKALHSKALKKLSLSSNKSLQKKMKLITADGILCIRA